MDFVFNNTGIPVSDGYAAGAVTGTIGFASVELGGYKFDHQAFTNATDVEVGGIFNEGLDGLIGLSFNGPVTGLSPIPNTLQGNGSDASQGQPFLYNIFDQTPDQDNFIGMSLSRTDDLEGSAEASLTINEVDAVYAAVVNAPLLPLFPGEGSWNILVDGISVDGVNVSLPQSTVPNAPAGKISMLMDTGTPTGSLPSSSQYTLSTCRT
ncbi:hypothetical protein FB451DRAFT_1233397 [Mycena latifolia]|nr:hypothetical protein FB451DRAFT_1233397 [Mycena latifolia]